MARRTLVKGKFAPKNVASSSGPRKPKSITKDVSKIIATPTEPKTSLFESDVSVESTKLAQVDSFDLEFDSIMNGDALEDDDDADETIDLIDFATPQSHIDSNEVLTNSVELFNFEQSAQTNILVIIGFDGPIDLNVSNFLFNPIKPDIKFIMPDNLIEFIVPKRDYGRKRREIFKLLPLSKPNCRLSAACQMICDVADAHLVAPAFKDELLMSMDFHMDNSFGVLKW